MTTITPTTELEAINAMLAAIGEAPINSVTQPGLTDAVTAYALLSGVSREVQSRGWHFNTEREYPLAANADGTVSIPTNCLQVRVADSMLASYDLTWRSQKLYDRVAHTFVIGKTIKVNAIFILTFEDLPEAARWYITMRAARQFIAKTIGAQDLVGYEKLDEDKAEGILKEADSDTADFNILTGNYSVFKALDRRQTSWGSVIVQ